MDTISKGQQASRILDEPIVKEALSAIKAEIIEQWSATPARDAEGREWVWRHYKVAERFEAMLRGYIETGRIESMRAAEKESFAAKVKRGIRLA
jgi:hypothetical protein